MNELPNIKSIRPKNNPTIQSPSSPFQLSFFQNEESFMDTELYRSFLKNAETRFRTSIFYKHYKGHLMELGLDRSQTLGNITAEMIGDRNLHMHHFPIGLYSICVIIAEHTIHNNEGLTTFDLVSKVRKEHELGNIGVVFLDVTSHDLYHNTDTAYLSPKQVCGKWWEFLDKYKYGLTQDIAFKLLYWIKRANEKGDLADYGNLLELQDRIIDWSGLNNQVL